MGADDAEGDEVGDGHPTIREGVVAVEMVVLLPRFFPRRLPPVGIRPVVAAKHINIPAQRCMNHLLQTY